MSEKYYRYEPPDDRGGGKHFGWLVAGAVAVFLGWRRRSARRRTGVGPERPTGAGSKSQTEASRERPTGAGPKRRTGAGLPEGVRTLPPGELQRGHRTEDDVQVPKITGFAVLLLALIGVVLIGLMVLSSQLGASPGAGPSGPALRAERMPEAAARMQEGEVRDGARRLDDRAQGNGRPQAERLRREAWLQSNPAEELREVRRREDSLLGGYGWVDRARGVGSIPIEEAMDRVAADPDLLQGIGPDTTRGADDAGGQE